MPTFPSYRLYCEKSDESADFWIHCETIPERTHLHDWEISPHRHDAFFQIFCLSRGSGELTGQGEPRALRAPCAIFIPPGQVHGFAFSRDIDGLVVTALGDRLRSLTAADRTLASFASTIRVVPLADEEPDAAFAVDCVQRLHGELSGHGAGRLLLLEPLVTGALVALVRASMTANVIPDAGHQDRKRIETLTTLIAAHFREHRPVTFYASAIGVSPAHLNRLARASTGYSVQGLATLQIMEAARRDLVFTTTPVQAIAYSLGFSDPAYFNRFFRRHASMTPGAFREAERRKLAM